MMKKETIRVILGALVCSSLLLPQTSRAEAKAKAKAEAKVTALEFQLATSTTNAAPRR